MSWSPLPTDRRLASLRAAVAEGGPTAMILTNLANIRWLCGFGGSSAVMVVAEETATLITDGRYRQHAEAVAVPLGIEVDIRRSEVDDEIARRVADHAEIGFEGDTVPFRRHRSLAELVAGRLVEMSPILSELRRIKDPAELERLQAAAAIADRALARLMDRIVPGATERDLAARLDYEMARGGSERVSFDTIVATGPNSALPHAVPSDRELKSGDLVVIDFGATVDGYGSDMTRTLVVGGRPEGWQAEIIGVTLEAQQAGFEAASVGAATAEVDAACHSIIEEAGYGSNFVHGTGHSLGLEIHEPPFLSATSDACLEANMVVTVEPGIYLQGRGGVRIEDMVHVRAAGPLRMTKAPKLASSRA